MRIKLILAVLVLVSSWSVNAAVVKGLYEAEVLVPDQGRKSRTQAMSTALAEVFAKVSGRPDVVTITGVAEEMKKPSAYVQQYRYRKPPKNARDPNSQPVGQILWVRFGEKAVNAALRKNDVAVWGKTRPATLVWLAVEEQGGRYLLGGESLSDLQQILEKEGRRYGVKLIIPLLDLEDQMALKFADVWGNFQESIFHASERYQADAILVGKASLSPTDEWSAHWVLYENGQSTSWGSQSIDVADLMNSGVLGTLEVLASRFTRMYSSDAEGAVVLSIQDVNSLSGFARVSRYLDSLEQITSVFPASIEGNVVKFQLELRGGIQGLAQTISLGNTLRKVAIAAPLQAGSSTSDENFSETAGNATEHRYQLLP